MIPSRLEIRRPARPRRVAVAVDKKNRYGRSVLSGVARYVEAFGPWSLTIDPESTGRYSVDWLTRWQGDGVLLYVESAPVARRLLRARVPVVDVYGHGDFRLPVVANDDRAIGRLGARHLLDRGLRHFAFVGYRDAGWSEARRLGFSEALGARGHSPEVILLPHRLRALRLADASLDRLGAWLDRLSKPLGVMACSDRQAQRVLEACRKAGALVPEEVAVLGVDNDEETCRLSDPPLTSIIDDPETIGFEGARLLDRLMSAGRRVALPTPLLVPPLGVAERRSTDVLAVADRSVATMLRLIQQCAVDGLVVGDLVAATNTSRSALYRRFVRALGRTPHAEILRVRLERARHLLTETDLSVEEIAVRVGFRHPEYLSVAFRREIGQPPAEYRRRARGTSGRRRA